MPNTLFNRQPNNSGTLSNLDFGYPANVVPTNTSFTAPTSVQPNNAWASTWQQAGVTNPGPLNPGTPEAGGNRWANWRETLFGGVNPETNVQTPGAIATGLGLLQGGTNAYMAMRQYGMARRTFNENRRQFNLNYENQRKLTNAELSDRQRRRNAENPNSVPHDEYMAQWGI